MHPFSAEHRTGVSKQVGHQGENILPQEPLAQFRPGPHSHPLAAIQQSVQMLPANSEVRDASSDLRQASGQQPMPGNAEENPRLLQLKEEPEPREKEAVESSGSLKAEAPVLGGAREKVAVVDQ